MKKSIWKILLVLVVVIMMFAACSPQADTPAESSSGTSVAENTSGSGDAPAEDSKEVKKVGLIVQHMTDEWSQESYEAMVAQGPSRGYEITLADSEWELTNEATHVDTFLSMDLDMLLLQPADDIGSAANVSQFVSAGVPVLSVGVKTQSDETIGFVGWDTFDSGYKLALNCADYIEANLDGKADIALLTYPLNDNCRQRRLGFEAGLSERNIDANYVADQNFEGSRETAVKLMENILQTNKDVDVVWAAFDAGALGARTALEAANSSAKVWSCGGYGAEIHDLFAANDKYFVADYVVAPQIYIDGIFDAMDRYFAGEKELGDINVDFPIVTAENYKEIWSE